MIIGRKKEQAIFAKLLESKQAEFLTIYGRRRVGKTFLIREFFQKNIVFEFTGSFEANLGVQLFNFFKELQRSDSALEQKELPQSWAAAFNHLADYLYRLSGTNQKMVVFIDELPWLDTAGSGFMSAFEYFWNQHGSKIKNLLLVTCGSAASWIIKNLINAKGGLYNRITQKIELKPFDLSETTFFFESKNLKFTPYQITQLYMVMGGIPFYLQAIEQGKSVNQIIDSLCFDAGGLLSNEFNPLFHSLFKNAENHIAIVEALASHPYGLSRTQLLNITKISNGGTFVRVLDNLIQSGFVVLLNPFGKKEREAIFRIIDFYSIFYLKFIQNNVSNRPNTWQSLASSGNFNAWSGYAFENICLQHLNHIHAALGISGVFTKISSWRFAGNDEIDGAQVDLVIDRNDDIIHLCEAKFSSKEYIITKEYVAKLRHKRVAFEYVTKTKKAVVTSLLTTYPASKNMYYNEEIHSEISLEALF